MSMVYLITHDINKLLAQAFEASNQKNQQGLKQPILEPTMSSEKQTWQKLHLYADIGIRVSF